MAVKTLNLKSFFFTQVPVTATMAISQVFSPRVTFFVKLTDNSWVMYQLKNNELIKAPSLVDLLEKTYQVTENTFYLHAEPLDEFEKKFIIDVFATNDNFNLDEELMYKMT